MKLILLTSALEFQSSVVSLFKEANISNFSGSDIDGYKNTGALTMATTWFQGQNSPVESHLFFSFVEDEKVGSLSKLVENFNSKLQTDNPIRLAVLSIEQYI